VHASEEEISEDLIATIPDVADTTPVDLEILPDNVPTMGPSELAGLLGEVRRHFEATFAAELDQVEASLSTALADMGAQLLARDTEIETARQELEALREAHDAAERKLLALKAALADP
jgi:hypothetical protein